MCGTSVARTALPDSALGERRQLTRAPRESLGGARDRGASQSRVRDAKHDEQADGDHAAGEQRQLTRKRHPGRVASACHRAVGWLTLGVSINLLSLSPANVVLRASLRKRSRMQPPVPGALVFRPCYYLWRRADQMARLPQQPAMPAE